MPILKREADISPDDLFERPEAWWVGHLKSRQEKSFARYLAQYSIGYYLPQSEKRVRRSGRTFVSYLPLFPGYVFFRGDGDAAARARRSHLVVNLLSPQDQSGFEGEIRQLRDLQLSSGRLIPYPELTVGDPVLITEGVFSGYRGVIVREKTTERLIVTVSFIRQSVAVELDRESIKPDAGHGVPVRT